MIQGVKYTTDGYSIRPDSALFNANIYQLSKYDNGQYIHINKRDVLFTNFGSFRFKAISKTSNLFSFKNRHVLLRSADFYKQVYRIDSTEFYTSSSDRFYTDYFRKKVHRYQLKVPKQHIAPTSLLQLLDNVAYSTDLWAGVLGTRVSELLIFNSYEYVRYNLPIYLHQDKYRFEQNIGYGYADNKWKFSTRIMIGKGVWQFTGAVKNDLEEASNYFYTESISPLERNRNLFLSRFDHVQEAALTVRHARKHLSLTAGMQKRKPFFSDSLANTGPFVRILFDLPLRGSYVDYSNGHHQVLNAPHYLRLSTYMFVGKHQQMAIIKPIYYYSNKQTALFNVRLVATGHVLVGENPTFLNPIVSGNGIEFNTVTEATMETLQPTSLSSKHFSALYFTLQKTFSVSKDIPYQPSFFVSANGNRIWKGSALLNSSNHQMLGAMTYGELGFGIKNLFVFPLPVLKPAIGVGYFFGLYPKQLKELDTGSLKFTLRFFN